MRLVTACLIALGSNRGDRRQALDQAVKQLGHRSEIEVKACSRWHASVPVGGPEGQQEYLNGALLLETSVCPTRLLAILKEIEAALGRSSEVRWAARPIPTRMASSA